MISDSNEEFRIEQLDGDFQGEREAFPNSELEEHHAYRSGSLRDEQTQGQERNQPKFCSKGQQTELDD